MDVLILHIFKITAAPTARAVPKIAPFGPNVWINCILKRIFINKPADKLITANRCSLIPCKTEDDTVNSANNKATGAYHANNGPEISMFSKLYKAPYATSDKAINPMNAGTTRTNTI